MQQRRICLAYIPIPSNSLFKELTDRCGLRMRMIKSMRCCDVELLIVIVPNTYFIFE